MISDILAQASADIRECLKDDHTRHGDGQNAVYPVGAPVTLRIEALVSEADALVLILSTPPSDPLIGFQFDQS